MQIIIYSKVDKVQESLLVSPRRYPPMTSFSPSVYFTRDRNKKSNYSNLGKHDIYRKNPYFSPVILLLRYSSMNESESFKAFRARTP